MSDIQREFDLNGMNLDVLNRFMNCLSANLGQRYASDLSSLHVLLVHDAEGLRHGDSLVTAGELKEIDLFASI